MQYINAPNILLGIANPFDPDNTNNQVILILKYYLYKCRCLGDKPCIYEGTTYLKYCIKIEQITINFLFTTQKEYICKKCLPFESVLGVYNFSAVVLYIKSLLYAYHMFLFLYLYLPLVFVKNKQVTK